MSTVQPHNNTNVFPNLTAFKTHTSPEIGEDELSLIGEVAVVVESYKNGSSWYKVYSDGWIEQGGTVSVTSAGQALTYLKAFSNTDYTIVSGGAGATAQYGNTNCYNRTATGCALWTSDDASFNAGVIAWRACGY